MVINLEQQAVVPLAVFRATLAELHNRGPGLQSDTLSIRNRIAGIALSEYGNASPDKYLLGALGYVASVSWCGIYNLWVYRKAALTAHTWSRGPRVYGYVYPLGLKKTVAPQVGDTAYFNKNQHHAIVVGAHGTIVTLCNGNGEGGLVTVTTRELSEVDAFFSIQSLIDAKQLSEKE